MTTKEETLALERQPQDKFLDLIEKVIVNKDVDADKLRVLVDLQIRLEDRQAEKEFDAAMIDAQKEVQTLPWDKAVRDGDKHKNRYVSYPKIDEMLKPIREKYGFTETFGVEPVLPAPNMMLMYSDVIHKNGHRRRVHLPMPIDGQGPKGGGVMTGPQAVGNGSSYGMRYLEKLIWKIPMLVDKDDNDGNAVVGTVTEAQVKELRKLFDKLSLTRQKKALEYLKLEVPESEPFGVALENLPARGYNNALKALATALRTEGENGPISRDQEATLTALIEGIGGSCKVDFLKTNRIKKVGDLPANQYQGALAALNQQRRKQ